MARAGINSYAELSRQTGIPYSSLLYKEATDSWKKDDIKVISSTLALQPEQTVLIFGLS